MTSGQETERVYSFNDILTASVTKHVCIAMFLAPECLKVKVTWSKRAYRFRSVSSAGESKSWWVQ